MSFPFPKSAFTGGEFAPGLYGRTDLARYGIGAATMRNLWPKFSGGAYSRAGTAFTGFSKQTGRAYPPRLIPFQFNINQGLVLEFGNQYMRVISNGAYVTEPPLPVLGITQANPAVVTTTSNGATAATPNNGAVTASYAPGELITLAGGVGTPAILRVTNTKLLSTVLLSPGAGVYAPADTINLTGGTQTTPAVLTVVSTQVVSATIAAAGAGGTDGTQTVTGTTGTGTKFQASVTIAGGAITAVLSITVGGAYTVNPTTPATEPVTGAGVGAQLNVKLGVRTFTVSTPGVFTANPTGGTFSQSATSGTGTGATFQSAILGPNVLSVSFAGAYTATPPNPVAQAATSLTGLGATFTVTFLVSQPFLNGDWVQTTGVVGMTQVNGQVFVVANAGVATFELTDVYGNNIDSTMFSAYVSGGQIARIYTTHTPYQEQDLEWLKWAQSADVMSFCCVNQESLVAYQPQDLTRNSNTDWSFAPVSPAPTIDAPSVVTVDTTGFGAVYYQYVVTAVNPHDGSESLPSPIVYADTVVNVNATAGTITIAWSLVPTVTQYNVYRSVATFGARGGAGIPFGLIGSASGATFPDSGETPDFNVAPPTFANPFLGQSNYPSVVAYVQERRVYGNTLNNPDTYFMSQPGAFTNFDTRDPPIDSDAITGSPWSTQVDGIQAMVNRPGGLVVLTGKESWQLTGAGGSSFNPTPITPSTQQAQPQAFNGCHSHVMPIVIGEEILYVQAKGSIVRDLTYQYFQNIYTGIDLTLNSSHLFLNYQIQEWAWAEEPYKILWAVRTDGVLLSLTFIKTEQISGWARHDSPGASFCSVCSVTEPPVDAVYVAVHRLIGGRTAYTVERMDNRLWTSVDQAWCVDSALSLPQPAPQASLTIGTTLGSVTAGTTSNPGNSLYSALTTATVVDANGLGPGTGAVPTVAVVAGVPSVTFAPGSQGTGYVSPKLVITDPAGSEGGSGAVIDLTLTNTVNLLASGAVFSPGDVGSVIRAAGGVAQVTVVNSAMSVTAVVIVPFTGVVPVIGTAVSPTPVDSYTPVSAGNWTLTAPVSTVTGLNHLIGATVTGVADGNVIPLQVVSAQGTIVLATPASNIVIGLGFTAQLQTLYLDTGQSPTTQGQRKKAAAATVRMDNSRAFSIGANQVDGSTTSPATANQVWNSLVPVPDLGVPPYGSTYTPLATGDLRVPLPAGWSTKAQVACQQTNPLPMSILAIFTEDLPGDLPQLKAPQAKGRRDTVSEDA